MVALEILDKFTQLPQIRYVGVEDFTDRLNFQYTVLLLLAFFTTVTLKTYVLTPVSCYMPTEIGAQSGQEQYINNYCWSEGTFAVPVRNFTIKSLELDPVAHHRHAHIMYYQWVPLVLGLQALLFYLPRFIWSFLSYYRAGTDVGHLIKTANDAVDADGVKHDNLLSHVTRRLQQMLDQVSVDADDYGDDNEQNNDEMIRLQQQPQQEQQSKSRLGRMRERAQRALKSMESVISMRLGHWLMVSYAIVKLCCLANAIGQLFMMRRFLEFHPNNWFFGITLLWDLMLGYDWHDTMVFPRVGCCAVPIKTAAGFDYLFAQCTLSVNMINEKIYIFLWFWIGMAAVLTALSLPFWFIELLSDRRHAFIIRCFKLSDNFHQINKKQRLRFVRSFLGIDGIFLLRMISLNSGDVVCTEIICRLWSVFCRKEAERHKKQRSQQQYSNAVIKATAATDDPDVDIDVYFEPDAAADQQLEAKLALTGENVSGEFFQMQPVATPADSVQQIRQTTKL